MSEDPEEYVAKKVNEEIINDWLTLAPSALGTLGLLWGALFSSSSALLIGTTCLMLGLSNFLFKRFKLAPRLAERQLQILREEQKKEIIKKLDRLGPELKMLGCNQGAAQIERLTAKFTDLNSLVMEKMSNKDVHTKRVSRLAEELYLAAIENLDHARQILKSIQSIDTDYIDEQLKDAPSAEEKDTLLERRQLKLDALEEADACISKNEVALTKLNLISIQLVKQKSGVQFDMESSLHEITNNIRMDQWEKNQ
jgi:hypothetical protein